METIFFWSAIILLLQCLLSLAAVLRLARYAAEQRHAPRAGRNQPKAVLIVPCKGLEHDFEENVRAFFAQDYREYELIFVTESEADPAYSVLARLIKQSRRSAWLVVAGEAQDCGQKVHNLCAAVEMLNAVDRRAEILVFADSDARPAQTWLAELVAPLNDRGVGATTGFRWYLPVNGGMASWLLSAWNAGALTLLGERSSFAWGGATAILREQFDGLDIKGRWQGALSDDYVLTTALHEAGLRIKFVPACLTASHADASWAELLEFTARQLRITRIYAPRVWGITCFSQLLFNFTFWGGGLWALLGGQAGAPLNSTLPLPLLGILGLGAVTAWLRATVAAALLTEQREQIRGARWRYALSAPLIPLVNLYNLIASAGTRRIVWRGIGYEMVSPGETVILHRPAHSPSPDHPSHTPRKRKASARSPR